MAVANSYAEGWREWDERYADLVIGKRNWQIVAAAFAAVSIVLAVGMVWQSARSRYVPYIVEVDKLGYALTQAQPLTAASPPDGSSGSSATKWRPSSARHARCRAMRKSSTRLSTPCWRTRAELPIPFWTSTTTRITGLMIRSTSGKSRSRPFQSKSIPSSSSRPIATRSAGPKCGEM